MQGGAGKTSGAAASAGGEPTHVRVQRALEPLLGDFTAQMAVKTAAMRALKRAPEALGPADLPALLEALQPMLHTFLGKERAQAVLSQLQSPGGR
jgi:NAD(P)H-dependent FMN reductase